MTPKEAKATGNAAAKKIVDEQEKMKADITKLFESAFQNSKVGDAFAKEAMTGWEKFGGKAFSNKTAGDSNGEATHMLIWDYRMDRMNFLKIDDSFISTTAKKMRIRPDIKSGSYKIKGEWVLRQKRKTDSKLKKRIQDQNRNEGLASLFRLRGRV